MRLEVFANSGQFWFDWLQTHFQMENFFQFKGSRMFSFCSSSGETDSIICPLGEAPVATKPLLELKPVEGGHAQGIPVSSERVGSRVTRKPHP